VLERIFQKAEKKSEKRWANALPHSCTAAGMHVLSACPCTTTPGSRWVVQHKEWWRCALTRHAWSASTFAIWASSIPTPGPQSSLILLY